MAMKKAFCCLSVRTGSLVILSLCLINSVWSMLSIFTTFGNSMYKEFLNNYGYIFYTSMFIAFIGSLIYLATILSIANNTSSKSLLNTVIAFLLLDLIYTSYVTYIFTSKDVFDKMFLIENEIQQFPHHSQEEMWLQKEWISTTRTAFQIAVAINALFVLYFVLVLRSFLAELKENHIAYTSAQVNINGTKSKVNFSVTSPNPQVFDKPPPYSTQTVSVPQTQHGVNQITYPTRQLQQIV